MIIRYDATLFESEEGTYYKPARVNSAFSTNYRKYESNSDKNKVINSRIP